ncbi:hypothetical protein BFW01_g866 [Lasiodiplodia theobromae]|uniref:Fungal-specific transcription factor domain-containing protein n=1 Tax=Lasiodiplodia theobromae TaxID=45133 RepID=A0A8H7IRH0_9PEZI|nr:hypothetical protein BFW01_g866 [Lasiodiplodia theobromae]
MAEAAESSLVDPQLSATQELDDLSSWPTEAELTAFDESALCNGDIPNDSSHQAHEDRPEDRDSPGLLWPEQRIQLSDLGPADPENGERRGENQAEGDSEVLDGNTDRNEASDVLSSLLGDRGIPDSLMLMLNQYNNEFCVLPLTSDFEANPFRCHEKLSNGSSQLLIHSILALSYRHINRITGNCSMEARQHKEEALKLLEQELHLSNTKGSLLDAVLILITLDCATSAHGPWVSHLSRAYSVLESAGGLAAMRVPRARAQIEMLVWWDVTLALTSRKGYVMPESYLCRLFGDDNADYATTISFYNVSGCPRELFKHMVCLAKYARELELASTMTCVSFRNDPVLDVEKSIREWAAEEYGDICGLAGLHGGGAGGDDLAEQGGGGGETVEEKVNAKQDLHHCAEAWRYALLFYVERVFKWDRKGPPSPRGAFLARKTLNHVWCCRRSTMVQKQLLLPVFLAGCETKDPALRALASEYCAWWSEKTRYDMFTTTSILLDEVWASTSTTSWWGSVIDEKSGGNSLSYQYLFG